MKIGINMFLWTHYVEEKHFSFFHDLKAAGYDGVEIPLIEGDAAHYKKIATEITNAGLLCTATSTCMPDKNIISEDSAVRQAGLDQLKWAVDMSHILGSSVIGGPIHSAPGVFSGNRPTEEELSYAADNLRSCGEYAAQAGVSLAIEYLNRFESYLITSVAETKNLVKQIGLPNVGIHYDTHHAHYEEYDIEEAILLGGSDILHVQFSESNRGLPGKGQVNWAKTVSALKKIGYDDWITIESFTHKTDILRSALHIWRELYQTEKECYLAGIELVKKIW